MPDGNFPRNIIGAGIVPGFRSRYILMIAAGSLLMAGFWAAPASAEFRVCNKTPGRIGLVIGVREGPIFITQGWFNLKPNACETPIRDDLKSGPYYVYGVDYDRGGEWSGSELLCVGDREFYVEGSSDCYARGYERAGFRRIDTNNQKNWTLNITDDAANPPTPPPFATSPAADLPSAPKLPPKPPGKPGATQAPS